MYWKWNKTGKNKNDLIILLAVYQRGLKNEEEHDSDVSSITDIDEQSIMDTS